MVGGVSLCAPNPSLALSSDDGGSLCPPWRNGSRSAMEAGLRTSGSCARALRQVQIFFHDRLPVAAPDGMFTSQDDHAEQMLAFIETYTKDGQTVHLDLTPARSFKHEPRIKLANH
jgi:hypothetical protein